MFAWALALVVDGVGLSPALFFLVACFSFACMGWVRLGPRSFSLYGCSELACVDWVRPCPPSLSFWLSCLQVAVGVRRSLWQWVPRWCEVEFDFPRGTAAAAARAVCVV